MAAKENQILIPVNIKYGLFCPEKIFPDKVFPFR